MGAGKTLQHARAGSARGGPESPPRSARRPAATGNAVPSRNVGPVARPRPPVLSPQNWGAGGAWYH